MSVKITHVDQTGSLARAGITPGVLLETINSHLVQDQLDVYYYSSTAKKLQLGIRDGDIEKAVIVRNERYEPSPGFEVEPIKSRRCGCNCIFCFVHQQPKGLRNELYVQDEDYRFSFLHGNYITCTNLMEKDIARITRFHLSPLYVSVHTTNPALRKRILGRKSIPDIMTILRFFKRKRISFHTQIVLCPDINDGAELEATVRDLVILFPSLRSIAIVPVGLTAHREGLPILRPVDRRYTGVFLSLFRRLEKQTRTKTGERILFASDEFYHIAGKTPPMYRGYETLPQIENGVGMYAGFYRSYCRAMRRVPKRIRKPFRVGVVTSPLGSMVISRLVQRLNQVGSLTVNPIVVKNRLFGHSVTVTGLLAGKDILERLQKERAYDLYLLPGNSLRHDDTVFLDNVTLEEVRHTIPSPVKVVSNGAEDFITQIFENQGQGRMALT